MGRVLLNYVLYSRINEKVKYLIIFVINQSITDKIETKFLISLYLV